MDFSEHLVAENFMNLDIDDTATDGVDQLTDHMDIEDLLKVNRIIKCSKNKAYLDLDTNTIENLVTENFMNFDITDIETDRIDKCKQTNAVQTIFDLDDFYKTFVSETDVNERANIDNVMPIENRTIYDNDNVDVKSDISVHLEEDNIENSKQEFEEILRSYECNETVIENNDILEELINVKQSDEVDNIYNVIEVPIEFEESMKNGIVFSIPTLATNAKQDANINKLETISIRSDSEISRVEVNGDDKIRKVNYLKKEISFSSEYFNEASELPIKINSNVNDSSYRSDHMKVNIDESIFVDSESECEGYHSSDFEFITESEAKQAGIITNNKQKVTKLRQKFKDLSTNSTQKCLIDDHNTSEINKTATHQQSTKNSKYWSKSYNRRLVVDQYYKDLKNNRENHEMPQGDAYLNMFQGIHASTSVFLENKSVISPACMTIQEYDIDGMRMMGSREECVDKQLQEQARESSKRILEKYPGLNRRKRRRC